MHEGATIDTLYELYDATYLAMTPARWTAAATRTLFGNPLSPFAYSLPAKMITAAAEVWSGVVERHEKAPWDVSARMEVIVERPFCRLIHFARDRAPGVTVPRILLVAPLSGHFATLLRGTVDALLIDHDVYVTDWVDAREVPLAAGRFDLDDNIAYLLEFIRLLGPAIHLIAVCQPGPAVIAAVALLATWNDPAQPRSMTVMGGPVDPRAAETAPTLLAEQQSLEWFEQNCTTIVPARYPGAGRRVYPGFLQIGAFIAMNTKRHVDTHIEMFNDLVRGDGDSAAARRKFYDEYLTVMDVTAEYYLQTIETVFKTFALPRGTMMWRGEPVLPKAIERTALMTVEGENDDISAPGQTLAAQALCSSIPDSKRANYLVPGVGHYGIFNGSRWRSDISKRITDFIDSNDQ
ncbi:MAG: polyhydroxyalkanoate depolymerase [Candidatus Velthaea sp.]